MNKKLLLTSSLVSASLLVASFSPVFAEDGVMHTMDTTIAPTSTTSTIKTASKTADVKDATKKKLAEAEDAAKLKIASKTAEIKEKIASKEATLKERLAAFKDKKKANLVEKINQSLININQKRTSEMLKHLDTMGTILDKAQGVATQAQTGGKDVSGAMTDLESAKNAIANAKTAVDQQSKKSYEVKISSESGVKMDVKTTRDLLEKDLKSTHSLVAEARRALMNGLVKLAQSLGEGVSDNGSK